MRFAPEGRFICPKYTIWNVFVHMEFIYYAFEFIPQMLKEKQYNKKKRRNKWKGL